MPLEYDSEYDTFFRADAAGRYNHSQARDDERSPSPPRPPRRRRSRQRERMRRSQHFVYSESSSNSDSDADTPAPRAIDTEGGEKREGEEVDQPISDEALIAEIYRIDGVCSDPAE